MLCDHLGKITRYFGFAGQIRALQELEAAIKLPGKHYRLQLSSLDLQSCENKIEILEAMFHAFKVTNKTKEAAPNYKTGAARIPEAKLASGHYFRYVADWLIGRDMTEQFIADILRELKRLNRVLQFLQIKYLSEAKEAFAKNAAIKSAHDDVSKVLYGIKHYTDGNDAMVVEELRKLNEQIKAELPISEQEKIEIKSAMRGQVRRWYKCPKGHLYGVGNCGMGNEVGRCPDCGSAVGGSYAQNPQAI